MERLQAAIEKARKQRDGHREGRPTTPKKVAASITADLQDAWDGLAQIELRNRVLHRNRIVTFQGGPDAAPFDLLRTRILQQARKQEWRRVAFVSPHSGCGKTTTVANLAFSLSRQQNIRTMIFDFDLRRRGLTDVFRQTPGYNMTDVLDGRVAFSDHARRYGRNVAFGFNRSSTRSASEILQSPKTAEILDEIEAIYQPDVMLFDLPPLMSSDDNFGFLQNVDCALLMAAAEKTTMSQIDVAERQVAELTSVMGIILNRCRYTDGAYGHDYNSY